MAKYPAQLQSANLNEFGIVYAEEIQGHKTVATLNALYAITDPILSKSVVNTNNDAIGQEWFVTSEGCYYRLDNWANRHTASGWTKLQVIDTEFNSLSAHGADKIKNFTTSPSTVTLNYNTWRSSTVNEDGTAVINAATQSAAGVLSAADKTKLDGLNTDSINDISVKSDANKATITFVSDNGNEEDISTTIDFPISTSSAAGTMSAKDKTELDRINTANFALGAVIPAASTVGIAASKTNVTDGTTAANNITLPAATQSAAGVLSAADKTKLDGLNTDSINDISVKSDANKATITFVSDNGNEEDISTTIDFPISTSSAAGTMSAKDKTELDRINTANFALGAVIPAASTVGIAASKTNVTDGTTAANNITLPAATQSAAGVLSAADKTELDRITTANFALGAVTPAASSVAIAATKTTISTGASAANNITLPAATSSVAGVMTAADKVKLDTTLPNLINSNKTTIDNYTVNGIKISTNPVVTGANTKVTGYSKPTTTGAIAATDSINGALGKLEKKLDDEVTNRTNAVSNLTNTVNNNKTTIDNYTVGGIKISANPKVANGTNTTVSTANSTITWSLNSTISLTRVNASSGFYQTSDKRLKSDIKPLEHTLEEICSIPTDSFILGGKKDLGTIAQELEPTFPELVTDAELKQSDVPNPENFETIEKDGETYVLVKEVDYAKMSVLAIEGIKLLKAEIDELKKQLLDK